MSVGKNSLKDNGRLVVVFFLLRRWFLNTLSLLPPLTALLDKCFYELCLLLLCSRLEILKLMLNDVDLVWRVKTYYSVLLFVLVVITSFTVFTDTLAALPVFVICARAGCR